MQTAAEVGPDPWYDSELRFYPLEQAAVTLPYCPGRKSRVVQQDAQRLGSGPDQAAGAAWIRSYTE